MHKVYTAFVLLVALAASISAGCKRSEQETAKTEAPSAPLAGKSVLLVTLESARPDRLHLGGGAGKSAINALAANGVRFDQAFAQVPITLPSAATLMTGAYPPENTIRVNGQGALPAALSTLAEVFHDNGYRTAAFIGSDKLQSRFGLDRGFEVYQQAVADQQPTPVAASATAAAGLAWLEKSRSERFLAWLHLPVSATASATASQRASADYDAALAATDAAVGQVVDWLNKAGMRERVLVVFVGLHGTSLGEHGYWGNGLLLYEPSLHVPLVFSLPGALPEGEVRDGIVQVVDVMPTVLELMGWVVPEDVSGDSLAGAINGASVPGRIAYSETQYPLERFGWAALRSATSRRWQYVFGAEVELYDRSSDPQEEHNVAEANAKVADQLEAKLISIEEAMVLRESRSEALAEETLQGLRSLGYVGSATQDETAEVKSPRSMLAVYDDYRQAETLLAHGRAEPAIELLNKALKASPQAPAILSLLGQAYAAMGQFERAEQRLMDAIAQSPGSAGAYVELARVFQREGKKDQAMRTLRDALKRDPSYPEAKQLMRELGGGEEAGH